MTELYDVPFEQDIRELCMAYGFTPDIKGRRIDKEYEFNIEGVIFRTPVCENRFDTKCELKRGVYLALRQIRGFDLPWGTLTGIRPTKLAMQGLDFKKLFLTSDEKIKLCFETAEREAKILADIDFENGWSLYIGIPFCPSTCLYCSFTSYPIGIWKKRKAEYIDALCKEIKAVAQNMRGRKLQTIYMGGGTPTSLEADELKKILDTVSENCDMSNLRELTVEAGRPDSTTEDKLRTLKECGVTRISINPQTMNDKTLKNIGRLHSVEMVKDRFIEARALGFDNINMDIIVGLPGEKLEDVKHTMDELEKLSPESITVHALALKHAARLNREKELYEATDFKTICDMIELTGSRCEAMNLKPYYMYRQKNIAGNHENVGYTLEGKECMYNILIMEEKQPIVGCGAGCSTKIPIRDKGVRRIENVKDPGVYIDRIEDMIKRKEQLV